MNILTAIKEKLLGKSAATTTTATKTAEQIAAEAKTAEVAAAVKATPNLTPQEQAIADAFKANAKSVDVEAILEEAVKAKGIKLNWRESIVDLLKALDLDSSLQARIQLAKDLNYSGSAADGSAEKNIWLHQAVLKELASNGGKVPAGLIKA
jgi:hypothetical protein